MCSISPEHNSHCVCAKGMSPKDVRVSQILMQSCQLNQGKARGLVSWTAGLWLVLQITWQQVHAISCWSRSRALGLHHVQHKGYFFTVSDALQSVVISSLVLCCVRIQTEGWANQPFITQQPCRHLVTSSQKLV